MKYIYKLGPHANGFSDSALGISITRKNPLVSDKKLVSPFLSRALRGGHVILEVEEDKEPIKPEDINPFDTTPEELGQLTKNQIKELYGEFFDEEDMEALKNLNKESLVNFCIDTIKEYTEPEKEGE